MKLLLNIRWSNDTSANIWDFYFNSTIMPIELPFAVFISLSAYCSLATLLSEISPSAIKTFKLVNYKQIACLFFLTTKKQLNANKAKLIFLNKYNGLNCMQEKSMSYVHSNIMHEELSAVKSIQYQRKPLSHIGTHHFLKVQPFSP